jgi:hypothetical protein
MVSRRGTEVTGSDSIAHLSSIDPMAAPMPNSRRNVGAATPATWGVSPVACD